jgi:hypothetical protein
MLRSVVGLLFLFTAVTEAGWAQMEIGLQTTAQRLNPDGEGSASLGARASYDLHFMKMILAPEVEFNYFGDFPGQGSFQAQLLAGARAGFRTERLGFFLKARPGVVHFSGDDFTQASGSGTHPAADVGGVFEWFVRPGAALRLDCGETFVHFPHADIVGGSPISRPTGWYHSLQIGVGVSVRF